MKLKLKLKKTFIRESLVYTGTVILGFISILVFYFVAKNDVFYLYDKSIIIDLNGAYKIDIDSKYDIKDAHLYVENPNIASIDEDGNVVARNLGETRIIVSSKNRLYRNTIDLKVSDITIYSIVFEEDNISIKLGETYQLNPVFNSDSYIKSSLIWTSSDESVAKVSDTGSVFGINSGTTIITASDKVTGLEAKVTLHVEGEDEKELVAIVDEGASDSLEENVIDVESINLNTKHLDMYIGEKRKVSAIIEPSDATDKKLLYESSDTSIATVDSKGIITAKKKGICNIFISSNDGNVKESMIIKVTGKKVNVTGLKINEDKIKLDINENYMLNTVVSPSSASDKRITYSSSDEDVATINENGKIKAIGSGNATIVAISRDGEKIASTIVEVSDKLVEVSKIKKSTIEGFKSTMIQGEKVKIDVSIIGEDDKEIKVNLTTSNEDIATIDSNGNLVAIEPGIVYLDIETIDNSFYERRLLTVFPGEVEAELIYINKTNLQLVKGKGYDLVATVIPEDASNKELVWTSSNSKVVKVSNNGHIDAVGVGTATITATVKGTGVKKSVKVAVVGKQQLIDVRNKKLTGYYINFKIYEEGTTTMKPMQNFAILNKGKKNETIYVSYPTRSTIRPGTKATTKLKKDIMRTTIVQIPKSELYIPLSEKRKYMYLNTSGHGQTLDLEQNGYIWTNGGGYTIQDSTGVYWGKNNNLVKVKFKANKKTSSYSAIKKLSFKYNNKTYSNPEISFDWSNNLAAVRSGRQVLIYNAKNFVNGKLDLLYSFTLMSNTIDGNNYSRQGQALSNGYYYQYRGYVGTKMYIEVYNLLGEVQYVYVFNPKLKNQEAEGFKIYNNQIYIGITSSCNGCNGRINSIYYFK